jgi:predicted negative regulator of RcsB-dependent stress response
MSTSAWYQGESLKRLLQGAAVGVVATLVIGFGWGGWMLGSSAKTLADSTASSAVVAAIAPICVDQFQHSADAANNLTQLKKTDSYEQAAYVEKGGWAMMPGSRAVESGVPQACAAILSSLK